MIGNKRVGLKSDRRLYREIYGKIRSEPDARLWFSPEKQDAVRRSFSWLAALWFLAITITFVADAKFDPSDWNDVNSSFFLVILIMLLVGVLSNLQSATNRARDEDYTYRFIAQFEDGTPIGVGTIYSDYYRTTCMIEVSMLPQYRGQKLGSVVGRLLIRYCFEHIRAHRVESTALSTNEASMRMHDGMIEEGTLKDRYLVNHKWIDERWFRILRQEWEAQTRTVK